MTTKPASIVQEHPSDSLESIAYSSVSSIPSTEPNDLNRLGYHVWRWLVNKEGSLEEAIHESGARIGISKQEALRIISEALKKRGL